MTARTDEDPDLPSAGRAPLDAVTLGSISVGGVAGSLARYGLGVGFPTAAGTFPSTTLAINLTGSLLLGLLVGVLVRHERAHRLLRPALGTGVLGGYTTFSTFAVEADRLVGGGHVGVAAGYLAASLAGGVAAAALGLAVAARA